MEEDWLTIDEAIHRDQAGNLLPVTVGVELLGGKKIKVFPVTKGEMQTFRDDPEAEEKVILKHCLLPKFTPETLKEADPKTRNGILFAIMSASTGVEQSEIKEQFMKGLSEVLSKNEEILKKKVI